MDQGCKGKPDHGNCKRGPSFKYGNVMSAPFCVARHLTECWAIVIAAQIIIAQDHCIPKKGIERA